MHRAAGQRAEGSEADAAEEAFFKRYLEYARSKVSPRLSEAAAASLVSQYVELREQARAHTQLHNFPRCLRQRNTWQPRAQRSLGRTPCACQGLACSMCGFCTECASEAKSADNILWGL